MESETLKLNSKEIMNKGELYNFISGKKTLSKEDINSSLEGKSKIDASELDDFDKDALEGWTESGLKEARMSNVSKKLGFSGSNLNLVLAGIISIVILVVLFWPLINPAPTVKSTQTSVEKQFIEETDIFIAEKFDTLTEEKEITAIEIVALRKTQKAQPKILTTSIDKTPVFDIEVLPIKQLETKPVVEQVKISSRKKIKEVYFHTFKLIDYRLLRSKPTVETRQMNLTGTSANLDSTNQKPNEVVWQTIDVPYIDYLEKTMYYFDKGNLKKVLARFDIILDTYPGDINALFYSGFAFYNLNEFDKAQNRFEQVLKSNISNFDEEAMWYLGLSFEKLGQTKIAKEIFKTISESGSFYSEMAKKKL